MKLKFLFFFLALLLTAVWTILLVLTLKERGALFYIGDGVITFSLVFMVYFYRKVVRPLDIIGNGMDCLLYTSQDRLNSSTAEYAFEMNELYTHTEYTFFRGKDISAPLVYSMLSVSYTHLKRGSRSRFYSPFESG